MIFHPKHNKKQNQAMIHDLGNYEFVRQHRITLAASCASFCSVATGYPFDSIKTRMQANNYPSIGTCLRETYKVEGLMGFYRGIGPLLFSVTILRSAAFNIYTGTKSLISEASVNGSIPNGILLPFQSTTGQSILAGSLTGSRS
jgi:Mitochondrial carrier protein